MDVVELATYGVQSAQHGQVHIEIYRVVVCDFQALGQGNIPFLSSADYEQDWQPYPVDPYSCYMC